MTTHTLPTQNPGVATPEKEEVLNTMDKAIGILVNSTLVLSIGLGLFMMLAAPGQPLDFLVSSTCAAGM